MSDLQFKQKIQSLLFYYPLYDYLSSEKEFNILCCLSDLDNSISFLSVALQCGTHLNKNINVLCLLSDKNNNSILEKCPALDKFFSINEKNESYGNIFFTDFNNINECIKTNNFNHFNYALLDEDALNIIDSDLFNQICSNSFVATLSNNDLEILDSKGKSTVFDVNYDELSRMALNVHICYENSRYFDIEAIKKRFSENLNSQSSLAFALSIPYKLKYFNLTLNDVLTDFKKIKSIFSSSSGETIKYLSYIEHKRWSVEKIFAGWDSFKTEEDFNESYKLRSNKISSKMLHSCLVKSTPKFVLNSINDWKNVDINSLDDLDYISFKFHQMYENDANLLINDGYLTNKHYSFFALEKELDLTNPKINNSFYRFKYILNEILNGSAFYSKTFDKYFDELKRAANKGKVSKILNDIKDELYPLICYNNKIDYKAIDLQFLKSIPFIVTNKPESTLCLPFSTLDIQYNNILQNVCSCLTIKPAKLVILINAVEKFDFSKLIYLTNCIKLISSHLLSTKICIYVLRQRNKNTINLDLSSELLKKCEITEVYIDDIKTENFTNSVIEICRQNKIDYFDCSTKFIKEPFVSQDFNSNIRKTFPCFVYDYNEKLFYGLDVLNYINDNSYITFEEVMLLSNKENRKFNLIKYVNLAEQLLEENNDSNYSNNAKLLSTLFISIRASSLNENIHNSYVSFMEICSEYLKKLSPSEAEYEAIFKSTITMFKKLDSLKFIEILDADSYHTFKIKILDLSLFDLFALSGNILELYCYSKILKSGLFDDVENSYVVLDEKDNADNEFDIVLTKGFKSCIIECKDRDKLDVNWYYKLNSVCDRFKISCYKVLVNNFGKEYGFKELNLVNEGLTFNVLTLHSKDIFGNFVEKINDWIGD